MAASPAQIRANQANSAKSTGPKTAEGKERSRQNSFKHGLTGAGVVLPNEDAAEVDRRFVAYVDELQPTGELGLTLVRRAALLSVRMDRCVSQETGAIAERVRQADADFQAPEGVDAATITQLRAEAMARAMFDPSKEATLARKYEAAAERGFFRALKELRQLEKQAKVVEAPDFQESFQDILASFAAIDKEAAEWEAKYPETAPTAPSKPANRFQTTDFSMPEGRVDVPFTIGRPS